MDIELMLSKDVLQMVLASSSVKYDMELGHICIIRALESRHVILLASLYKAWLVASGGRDYFEPKFRPELKPAVSLLFNNLSHPSFWDCQQYNSC